MRDGTDAILWAKALEIFSKRDEGLDRLYFTKLPLKIEFRRPQVVTIEIHWRFSFESHLRHSVPAHLAALIN